MPDYHATEGQILTFWKMLADRKWDEPTELIEGRMPHPHYLSRISNAYQTLIRGGYVPKHDMMLILDDMACFKGWSIERRMRSAKLVAR